MKYLYKHLIVSMIFLLSNFTLKATGGGGIGASLADFDFTVYCDTSVNFNAFTDQQTAKSYHWDFGDGSTPDSTQYPPTHYYPDTFLYNVTLIVEDHGGARDTVTKAVKAKCNKAEFSFYNTSCTKEFSFNTVHELGQGPTTYLWDFGDGGTSTDQYPLPHNYTAPGVYTVSLTVDVGGGGTEIHHFSKDVEAFDNNLAEFNHDYNKCVMSTNFWTNCSGAIATYTWDFGDGTISEQSNPSHTYDTVGWIIVRLDVIDTSQAANPHTFIDSIYVDSCNKAEFYTNPPHERPCGDSVQFFLANYNVGTGFTYDWNFGDGSPNSSLEEPKHLFPDSGEYNVSLEVTEIGQATYNFSTQVYVPYCNKAEFGFNIGYTGLCDTIIDSVFFHAYHDSSDIAIYEWDFGDGNTTSIRNPMHLYADSGNKHVTLITTDVASNKDTFEVFFYLDKCPQPAKSEFTYDWVGQDCIQDSIQFNAYSNEQEIVSFNWDFGDGNTSTERNPLHSFVTDSAYEVQLVIQDTVGNFDTTRYHINLYNCPALADFDWHRHGNCGVKDSVHFNPIGQPSHSAIYQWDFGDGNTSAEAYPLHPYSDTLLVNVTLIVSDTGGISDTVTHQLQTFECESDVDFIWNGVCEGDTTFFTNHTDGGTSWLWRFGDGNTSTTKDPFHVYTAPGVYAVTLVGNDGTHSDSIQNIVQIFPKPAISATIVDATCNGSADGSITISSVNSGAEPLSYIWSDSSVAAAITGLTAGTYFVDMMDTLGCYSSDTFQVAEPNATEAEAVTIIDASCHDASDGSIEVKGIGGVAPYAFSWNTGPTTSQITGLGASAFIVTVTDANACIGVDTFVVASPDTLSLDMIATDENCVDACDGSIDITVTGGQAPYTYNWSNAPVTEDLVNLCAGSYTVTVTDDNGCITANSKIISAGQTVAITVSNDTSICSGESVSLTATGADTYNWSNGSTTATINETPSTTTQYFVTGSTSAGCSIDDSVLVTVNNVPFVNAGADTAICAGGSATLTASGADTYLWSTGETSTTITVNPSANELYYVDGNSNGCAAVDTVDVVVNNAPFVNAGADTAICAGGSATLTASGADTYLWSTGETSATINVNPSNNTLYYVDGNSNGCAEADTVNVVVNNAPFVNAGADTAICAGGSATLTASGADTYLWSTGETSTTINVNPSANTSYYVDGTTSFGCSAADTINVMINNLPIISIAASNIEVCKGQKVNLTATGAKDYSWNNGLGISSVVNPTVNTTTSFLVNGVDINGCSNADTIEIIVNDLPSVNISKNDAACQQSSGSATANVTGGTSPYEFTWSTGATTDAVSNIKAGSYGVTVTDNKGCIKSKFASISDLDGPTVSITLGADANCGGPDGSATAVATGGATPYTFSWSGASGAISANPELKNLLPGVYAVDVIDDNGCIGSSEIEIQSVGNNPPSISGHVTSSLNGFNITSGEVYIYRDHGNAGKLDTVGVTTIDATGNYNFPSVLPIGEYLLQARPDTSIFKNAKNTYYKLALQWKTATSVLASCDSAMVVDIVVKELPPLGGTSDLKGKVIIDGANKWGRAKGDPVPGVDVLLEQIPGGVVATTITSQNGDYTFAKVPQGDYTIHVDVPGLEQQDSYDINVMTEDTSVSELDFFIGEEEIYIAPTVSIREVVSDIATISIYPNPYSNFTNIEYVLDKEAEVSVDIYSLVGELVYQQTPQTNFAGLHRLTFSARDNGYSSGMYMVKLTINGTVYTYPIVEQ